jgi:hypothetical protein
MSLSLFLQDDGILFPVSYLTSNRMTDNGNSQAADEQHISELIY